jgi:hypothetical protein
MNQRASLALLLLLGACGPSSESAGPDGGAAAVAPDGATASTGCAPIAEVAPTICSMDGAARKVIFKNGCAEVVDIWWVDHACGEKFYWRLAPGESYMQPSYVTHPWRARTVRPGGSPGATGGLLIKDFGTIPVGDGDLAWSVP